MRRLYTDSNHNTSVQEIYKKILGPLKFLGDLQILMLLLLGLGPYFLAHAAAPTESPNSKATSIQISTSIPPLYNIVRRLLPEHSPGNFPHFKVVNLISPQESPHDFYLKPSHLKNLETSDVIIWVGPALETGLIKALEKSNAAAILTLSNPATHHTHAPIHFLPARHTHDSSHHHDTANANTPLDPHIWLSPLDTEKMARLITEFLAQKYPEYRPDFEKNYRQFSLDLKQLHARFENIRQKQNIAPYYVYHDAYQYLEKAYQLPSLGPISPHPEMPLSAKQIQQILGEIQEQQARCLFTEPQFNPKILVRIQSLFKPYRLEIFEVNPLGPLNQDPIQTMEQVMRQFQQCKKI